MIRLLIFLLVELLFAQVSPSMSNDHPRYIAHAGGAVGALTYTNAREAFDTNYQKGFRFFEADVETTSDNTLVLLHDWEYSMERFYHTEQKIYSLAEFKKLKLDTGLQQLSWSEFASWLHKHPDARIVIDTKRNTIDILKKISNETPEITKQLIPQIYTFDQYPSVQALGFTDIILTLYASDYSDREVLTFAKEHRLWAVTMPTQRVANGSLAHDLHEYGIATYAHTINNTTTARELEDKGIFGFYTDFLSPV